MDFTYDIRAMLRKFGVVTVMNAKFYKAARYAADSAAGATAAYSAGEWDSHSTLSTTALFTLDTLKIANISSEGPTKTITGGMNADTLLKYGKTFTMEMQDGLGRYNVLDSIYGVNYSANAQIASVTDRFPSEMTIVGDTFVIDQKTGAKQPVHIIVPIFLGDGIFNLTQDAEGDATVFDLNGSILKFNGGEFASAAATADTSIVSTTGSVVGNGVPYAAGADNEFYFLCTDEAYDLLKTKDYSAVVVTMEKDGE